MDEELQAVVDEHIHRLLEKNDKNQRLIEISTSLAYIAYKTTDNHVEALGVLEIAKDALLHV